MTDVVVNLVDTGVGMSTKPWHTRCGSRPGLRVLAELRFKGITVGRMLIFSTQPMLKYLKSADASALKAPNRLYRGHPGDPLLSAYELQCKAAYATEHTQPSTSVGATVS